MLINCLTSVSDSGTFKNYKIIQNTTQTHLYLLQNTEMLKRCCLSLTGGGGNSQKERGNQHVITDAGLLFRQLVPSFFKCFDIQSIKEQGEMYFWVTHLPPELLKHY